MQKIHIAIILFIIILCGLLTTVLASGAVIYINGDNDVIGEKDNIITVQVQNSEAVGVIQGTIKFDSNIKDVKIVSSYNGWTATYNETTGKFNAFNAEGTSNGEVLQIIYKLSENANQGLITLKDIELTTISYDTIKIDNNITKTINKALEKSEQNNREVVENNSNSNADKETNAKQYGVRKSENKKCSS